MKLLNRFICFFRGHHINECCDWGFGFGAKIDVWCKRCHKMLPLSLDELKVADNSLYLKARKRIYEISGSDINLSAKETSNVRK